MAQYIDKFALVAEIEKKIMQYEVAFNNPSFASYEASLIAKGKYLKLLDIRQFINTLEVKEVDLEQEYKDFVEEDPVYNKLVNGIVGKAIAKHFFELGLKAKDWEKERMEGCPYRQVGCTMYEGHILECRGACGWVVDHLKLKELKAQKGEEV